MAGDRYPINPGDPAAQFEQRLRDIEQQLSALSNRTLRHAILPEGSITILDALAATAVLLDQSGLTVADGAITVGGGPVRAIDLDFDEVSAANEALTTTPAEFAVCTFTPPAWVTVVVVQAFCLFQMSNSSGAAQGIQYRATVSDVPSSGVWTHTVGDGETANVVDFYQLPLTRGVDFDTTVEASGVMGVTTGTNGANNIRTKATAYYLR